MDDFKRNWIEARIQALRHEAERLLSMPDAGDMPRMKACRLTLEAELLEAVSSRAFLPPARSAGRSGASPEPPLASSGA